MTTKNIEYSLRRFGGLERLYGGGVLQRLEQAHVMVAGIGGVGTWSAEALARSGVGQITLIDMDHIAESNINRQLHALSSTIGQSKVVAMKERIAQINLRCKVNIIDDFITPENTAELFSVKPDVVIDCTDQVSAKVAMVLEGKRLGIPVLVCGGAGGKTNPLTLRGADISLATYDALLSRMRNVLRRHHGFPKASHGIKKPKKTPPKMNVWALWFEQEVILPKQWQQNNLNNQLLGQGYTDKQVLDNPLQGLSCAGYGSLVTITSTMGMAAANRSLDLIVHSL